MDFGFNQEQELLRNTARKFLEKLAEGGPLVALIAIGMVSHVLLDLPTPMGAKIFYPFSNNYVHLDLLGYLDWTLFTLALFVLLATWSYAKHDTAVRRGKYAAAMTVKPGQKRSELQGNAGGSTLKVMPGSTYWFADSMYLAPGFPTTSGASNGWQTVLQWKDAGGTKSSSPPVSVDIDNGVYTLYGGYGCPSGPKEYRIPLRIQGAKTSFQQKLPEAPKDVTFNKYGESLAYDVIVNKIASN